MQGRKGGDDSFVLSQEHVDNMVAAFEDTQAAAETHGLKRIPLPADASTLPSNKPECGACGATGASKKCSGCQSVWYCNKSCQKRAWKKLGHNKECKGLKEACERDAKMLLDHLSTSDEDDLDFTLLKVLDCEGTYACAVKGGLHSLLVRLMREDTDRCAAWGQHDDAPPYAAVHNILVTVFRGQRRSRTDGGFGAMDGHRFAAFVKSAPDAWEVLLGAVTLVVRSAFRPYVYGHSERMAMWSQRIARDVITCTNLLFYKSYTPKAIFAPWTAASAAAATSAAKTLKAMLNVMYACRHPVDRSGRWKETRISSAGCSPTGSMSSEETRTRSRLFSIFRKRGE